MRIYQAAICWACGFCQNALPVCFHSSKATLTNRRSLSMSKGQENIPHGERPQQLGQILSKKKTQQNNTQVWEHIHGEQSLGKGVPGWGIKVKHKTRCREWCSGYHNIILTVRLMNYRNSSLNLQWFHHHRKCFFFFFFFFLWKHVGSIFKISLKWRLLHMVLF